MWKPFFDWLAARPGDFALQAPPIIAALPARHFWDAAFLKANAPDFVLSDDRPGAPGGNVFWRSNIGEAGWFIQGYESVWMPGPLIEPANQARLVDALFAASRQWRVTLHFNKGLAGAPAEEVAAARDTATNPAAADAFALAISASEAPPAFPGIAGHEPDIAAGETQRQEHRRRHGRAAQAGAEPRLLRLGDRTTSSPTGAAPSGARTTRGCGRSRTSTIPTACSSSTTASAARIGAPTASRAYKVFL